MKVLRGKEWFSGRDLEGFLHRSGLKAQGWTEESFINKPIIGIANSWAETTHCNSNLKELSEHVKRGVIQSGGFPLEFPTISLGEFFLNPTSMYCRNLMSMDVEEMIRGLPIDGVVLLSGCDKTTPAMIMGAGSANLPSILLTSGPQLRGNWRNENLGSCTDCRRYWSELRAGNITQKEYDSLESAIYRSKGHCMVMGTASTMACISEVLGIMLTGGAAIPAADSRRLALAEKTGKTAVEMVNKQIKIGEILSESAFYNAIKVLLALGGSTNAVIHLTAIAGRFGINLDLDIFDKLSRDIPVIVNLKPSGDYLMEDFFYAGGINTVLYELRDYLDLNCKTINGNMLGDNITKPDYDTSIIVKSIEKPIFPEGGLAVLKGSLSPDGAIIKHSAASKKLLNHTGKAVVFENPEDLKNRIDDPNLDVNENDILVMKNSGPVGGPGMPESGYLPLPKKLLQKGVRDMIRISDARMSGTAFGTIILHVAPESALGGPLALVENGDLIKVDIENRKLDLLVEEKILSERKKKWKPPLIPDYFSRGYGKIFYDHIQQAPKGCDFDFLNGSTPVKSHIEIGNENGFRTG
tara:strand:+ start:27956 stop:29698 length:1743 start_codon:yes stop_codon:yes gene_type:complete